MRKKVIAYLIGFVILILGIIFDKTINSFLTSYRTPFLNEIMSWLSFFGTWFIVLIIMTSLFLWQEKKREWIIPLWLSLIISSLLVYFLKLLFIRERPETALFLLKDSSFPSGHATAVFSTLAILDKEFPRFKWFWLGFALLVAFSRLYLGEHYLTDVVAGALIGYTISLLIVGYEKKLKFKIY